MSEREQVARDYAAGRLSRHEAMSALGTDYLGLLDTLADHGLMVPVLSNEAINQMADTLVRLIDETEPSPSAFDSTES